MGWISHGVLITSKFYLKDLNDSYFFNTCRNVLLPIVTGGLVSDYLKRKLKIGISHGISKKEGVLRKTMMGINLVNEILTKQRSD